MNFVSLLAHMDSDYWIAWGLIGGVGYAAWRYDAWRGEHGYVALSTSNVCPVLPDPQAIVAENEDKQQESSDEKKETVCHS